MDLVEIAICWLTREQVVLPTHSTFGLTAESDESPDSIEVFKFVTRDKASGLPAAQQQQQQQPTSQQQHVFQQQPEYSGLEQEYKPWHMDDALASTILDHELQFADLHDRLQGISHSIENLFRELSRHGSRIQQQVERVNSDISGAMAKSQQISALENKMGEMERQLQQLRGEQKDWSGHFSQIERSLKSRHDDLLAGLPESVGNGMFLCEMRESNGG